MDQPTEHKSQPASPDRLTRALRVIVGAVLALAVLAGAALAYMYYSTPAGLRHPAQAHFHFRLQIIADGQPVDFTQDKFQTEFDKDICDADLTKSPVHFHDRLDQFVHIHWAHITGGVLLKNYGWNLKGGPDNTLGYRFDQLPRVTRVPIHGLALPHTAAGDKYYIYTGGETSYQKRDWNEFVNSDLEKFFAGTAKTGLLDRLIPAASAHGAEEHVEAASGTGASQEELAQLNNLVGNAVIFVQSNEPTDAQIKDRFNHLIPLPQSACAG
jgi:hypothetical protein